MTDSLCNFELINLGRAAINKHVLVRFVRSFASCQWQLYVCAVTWFILLSDVNFCRGQLADQVPVQQEPAQRETFHWRTGAAFDESSKNPISVSWQHAELREHVVQFARSQQLAIVIDRRVDPNQQLNLTVKNVSIEQFLLRIAQASGTKFCRFGDCYYLGPPKNTELLMGIHGILTSGRQRKQTFLSRTDAMSWPSLTTPQAVLEQLSQENGFDIKDINRIEHDLMTELNIPPMRLDMRLALLLSQFDRWFKQSKSAKSISINDPPTNLKASVRLTGYDANRELLQLIRKTAPSCKVSHSKRSITVTGPTDELEMARNVAIESFEPKTRSLDQKRFQLNVKNKRGLILQAVAGQLGLEVQVEQECQDILGDVVAVKVKDATVEELLDAILAGTDCGYSQDDKTLRLYRR